MQNVIKIARIENYLKILINQTLLCIMEEQEGSKNSSIGIFIFGNRSLLSLCFTKR